MPRFTQTNRPLAVTTPLGTDVLLLYGVTAQESISRLFHVRLDVLAENSTTVAFDSLIGASITAEVELPGSTTPRQQKRYFNGICQRVTQGERDEVFTRYSLELVPQFWLLTRNAQSRTFQHKTVKQILTTVLTGVTSDLSGYTEGDARDYCVQYRETDFNFASRLMEEEGIFYYFSHANGSHTMILGDGPDDNKTLPSQSTAIYREPQNVSLKDPVITSWQKAQELRSGKYTVWDFSFEKPASHFDASKTIQPTVTVGSVSHNLAAGSNSSMELYDYPGEYAQRYDGVDKTGGGTQDDVGSKAAADATRVVGLRMQEEAVQGVQVQGTSNCAAFTSGYQFTVKTLANTLENQFKADGAYVLTGVQHNARIGGNYRSSGAPYNYTNSFSCVPAALPFRPARVTPRPVVHGTQTAVVVGISAGSTDDIFTDKYGRVKVQFPWDRVGTNTADSSCWCRVATVWASQQWGAIHIPRVGMEVIVAFEEGDPDRPIIVGSVYNYTNMPPYTLPDNKTQSGIKSRSTTQGTDDEFNEIRFEDKKSSELITVHAQKDFTRVVENNDSLTVGSSDSKYCPDGSQTISIYKDRTETVETGNETITIKKGNRTEEVSEGNETITIKKGNRTEEVTQGNEQITIGQGTRTVTVQQTDTHEIKQGDRVVKVDMGNDNLTVSMGNQTIKIEMGSQSTEAMQSIELKVGSNSIKIDQMGITLSGLQIKLDAQMTIELAAQLTTKISSQLQTQLASSLQTQVQGTMVQVSGSAMTQVSGAIVMIG